MKEQPRRQAISRTWQALAPASVLCIALLTGCAVGPDFARPGVAKNAGYSQEKLATTTASADVADGGAAQKLVEGMDIPGQWWTLFRSPTLNALVEEALKANADVAAAQAALHQAYELVYAEQASLFPSLSAGASRTRELPSAVTTFGAPSQIFTVNSASLSVSYAPDVFGGVRRQIE